MSKYGNIKTKANINGEDIIFASKAECIRAIFLTKLLNAGDIEDLIFQPAFEIQEKFKRNGKAIRAIKYIADFKYIKDGDIIIEDVKGKKTSEYNIKKKMFLMKHGDGLRFFEVMSRDGNFKVIEI